MLNVANTASLYRRDGMYSLLQSPSPSGSQSPPPRFSFISPFARFRKTTTKKKKKKKKDAETMKREQRNSVFIAEYLLQTDDVLLREGRGALKSGR